MSASFDPLDTGELIVTSYRRYLRSLLPVRDQKIAAALDAEITRSSLLAKGHSSRRRRPIRPAVP